MSLKVKFQAKTISLKMKMRLHLMARRSFPNNRRYTWATLFLILLFLTIWPVGLHAGDNLCDTDLFKSINFNDKLGYYPRDSRCEGRYIRKTGTHMLVVSLTESYENYDIKSKKELNVEWTPPQKETVWLRAYGIGPNLYYRMDTSVPSGNNHYRWPTDIISALRISRNKLGVVGWMNVPVDGELQRIYLPLRIWQHQAGQSSGSYEVILQSDSRLSEVYYSLTKSKTGNQPDQIIIDGKPLSYGNYAPRQSIKFKLSGLGESGVYHLEITANQISGVAADPVEIWFYHLNN